MKLKQCLNQYNWYMLRAIVLARSLEHAREPTKSDLVALLANDILSKSGEGLSDSPLSDEAQRALETLIALGGQMPLNKFGRRFGQIRPYKPWRQDNPHHPWRSPISPAETLWYQGLIFKTAQRGELWTEEYITIPEDLLALLPPVELQPFHTLIESAPTPSHVVKADLLYNVCLFLGFLNSQDIIPLHGRWLPPGQMQILNRLFSAPEDLTNVRSEKRTGRLRFLHYLCETAGLVALAGRYLKPTPMVASWLAASRREKWSALWDGWRSGSEINHQLWVRYELPGWQQRNPLAILTRLLPYVAQCPPAQWLSLPSFIEVVLEEEEALRDLTPWWQREEGRDEACRILQQHLTGPLAWLGVVSLGCEDANHVSFSLTSLGAALLNPDDPGDDLFDTLPSTPPFILTSDLAVEVPSHPNLAHLYRLMEYSQAVVEDDVLRFRFTPDSIQRALERGAAMPEIVAFIQESCGTEKGSSPLTSAQEATLWKWAAESERLIIRHLTVLETPEQELLSQLSAQRSIRPFFRRTLSPRVVVIDENQVGKLRQALRRQGYRPRVLLPSNLAADGTTQTSVDFSLDEAGTAYLWLAGQVYARLGEFIRLPVRPPHTLLSELVSNLSPQQLAAAEALAEETIEQLKQALDGWAPYPTHQAHSSPEETLPLIERAIEEGDGLEMEYWTEGRGEMTVRVVEPYRLEWRGEVPYLIAYCHRRHDERVFRLDRIRSLRPVPLTYRQELAVPDPREL